MTGDFLSYAYLIGIVLLAQLALVAIILAYDRHGNPQRHADNLGAEVTHNARLALAGELTASIAHEIAQPLSAILNNVETAELILKQSAGRADAESLSPILADIKRDDLRANEVVNRLRALLRKRELKLEPMDINALVSSAVMLVRADAGRRLVQLRAELEPDLPPVAADPVHMQQVLLNLLVNGMDAMIKTPPPARCLYVRTRLRAGSAVEITVRDNGHGIDPAHAGRLFESFFTTKEGGMGLGLSIARSIVQAHGGTIWAERARGGGSVFALRLPLPQRQRIARVGIPQLTSPGG
ncbi:sensor histidine kinase [Steroidobacter flavus]|uniref:histidine kinase n=1 Tax=Steroidobacter flavus TaxID=1842136 RepID=A0ABV8T3A1_9GAMM